jgi:hypothetical protein
MGQLDDEKLTSIRQQVAASVSEIARLEAAHRRDEEAASRLMDLRARVGMMEMLYGDRIMSGRGVTASAASRITV